MPYLQDTYDAHDPSVSKTQFKSFAEWLEEYFSRLPDEKKSLGVTINWIASSFDDAGEDWNRFDLLSEEGELIASRTVRGY